VDAPVQCGPRITAILIYLYAGQFLSKQRTAQALSELFGMPISAGTVAAASSRAARDVIGSGFLDRCVTKSSASELGAESPVGWLREWSALATAAGWPPWLRDHLPLGNRRS
jgi:hypothetical protein